MRKLFLLLLTTMLLLGALAPSALAYDLKTANRLQIAAGETVDRDQVFSGLSATIDGTLIGDLFAVAQSVIINGTIEGNLIVFAKNIEIRGRVTGLVVGAGTDVLVSGQVGGNLLTAGGNLTLTPASSVGRNWLALGDQVEAAGRIDQGVLAAATRLALAGSVGEQVTAFARRLEVEGTATVAGPITYHSDREGRIDPAASTGAVQFFKTKNVKMEDHRGTLGPWTLTWTVFKFLGFLLVGLLALFVMPQLRERFPQALATRHWQSALLGLGLLLVTPLAAILLLVSVIGMPLGFIALLLYPPAIYLGQVGLAWTAGRLAADRWEWLGRQHWVLTFVAGSLLTTLLTIVPGVGFIAAFFGLGLLVYTLAGRTAPVSL